jgi:hypothetical protein
MTTLDFNNAGEQRSFDVIPSGTLCSVQLTVRAGGAGDDGWLRKSKDSGSEALDCEFTVLDGEHAKRKIWGLYTVQGTTSGHADAAEISRKALCAMLEAARGILPSDKSEAAQKARQANSYGDFDQLRFIARIGVRPAQGEFPAKNTILEIITPDRRDWRKIEQLPPDASKPRPGAVAGGVAASPGAPEAAPTQGAVARPKWAQ